MKKTLVILSALLILLALFTQSCKREGCTNPKGENYDPKAKVDDGSCVINGCTNPRAENYDPDANFDDGSCIILGCTDPNSTNYDSQATNDDGSCQYPGQNIFWTDRDYGVGYISVYVQGSYEGKITSYMYSGTPTCGTSGFVTVEKNPGTYNFTAESQYYGYNWSGTFTVYDNECSKMRLYISKDNKTAYSDLIENVSNEIKIGLLKQ